MSAQPSIWQRRFVLPVVAQFRQGTSADQIALTIALASVFGVFPLLGWTTLLCGFVAVRMKLNQGIMQYLCLCLYPVHLATLLPFYRAGEVLFQQPHIELSIPIIIKAFFTNIGQFFRDYGMTGVRGVIVWALTSPVMGLLVYYSTRPMLRRWANRTTTA